MTDPILDEFQQATGLRVEDVMRAPDGRLDDLVTELLRHFPEHAHVEEELRHVRAGLWPDDEVLIHAWLLEVGDTPVGFTIFHTSLRRRVVLQHFVGMDPDAGRELPMRWVKHLADAVFEVGMRDCQQHGTTLLATLGENHPEHARTWERYGYTTLDIDYREPLHGRQWPEYGELRFFPMTPQIRVTDAGRGQTFADVVTAGITAFLLDHYGLPADEPTVVHTLALCAALSDPA